MKKPNSIRRGMATPPDVQAGKSDAIHSPEARACTTLYARDASSIPPLHNGHGKSDPGRKRGSRNKSTIIAEAYVCVEESMQESYTLGDAIRCNAELRPESPAIVATDWLPLSYEELWKIIVSARVALRGAGFDRNARIAVALPNSPQAALAIVAISCSAVAVPVDLRLALPEIEKRIALVHPAAIVLQEGTPSTVRTLAEHLGVPIIETVTSEKRVLDLRFLIPHSGPAAPLDEANPQASAFILQTSGTTSEPKLIPYSHRNMLATAARVRDWYMLTPDDRCLCVSPVYYCHGLTLTFLVPLITGGSAAFPTELSRFEPNEWFVELAPTWYSAAPTLHRHILDKLVQAPDPIKMHLLRFVMSGGGQLPETVCKGLQEALGVAVFEHYGASEAAQISANRPLASKIGTCGIPDSDVVRVVGEDGRDVARGQKGELWLGGPSLFSGYLGRPELNAETFVDGWFRTGDVGSLDNEGFLTLHGRKQELINRGGEKITPFEVDEVLMRHPAVAEAAAYPVPHPRLGEDVAAAVVLRPGFAVTPEELRKFMSSHLAWFKIPRSIVFQDQLPKGLTGKVQRQRLGGRLK
jgi:oxalate---CoA ligase